ncbi:hypothetical protein SDC9_192548 [bioreactor metagenome]|uniref:Uncharacterized protein n=1 Tax=bioreactor metagenome TaxID=1076179 RepID=A0A645I121_9ZZZZ
MRRQTDQLEHGVDLFAHIACARLSGGRVLDHPAVRVSDVFFPAAAFGEIEIPQGRIPGRRGDSGRNGAGVGDALLDRVTRGSVQLALVERQHLLGISAQAAGVSV